MFLHICALKGINMKDIMKENRGRNSNLEFSGAYLGGMLFCYCVSCARKNI